MEELINQNIPTINVFDNETAISLFQDESLASKATTKNCILIHGWKSTGNDMIKVRDAIMKLSTANGYSFWLANYDTNKPFIENSKILKELFQKQSGYNFDDALLIGYSMGGVVARSMLCQGFKFKNLVTICTPHEGLAPWIPTPTPGTMSIAPWSTDLKNLNNNPIDVSKRKNFYMFGITFDDARGHHEDDGVVLVTSAIGNGLGAVNRGKINLNYGSTALAGTDPHSRGMDPNMLKSVLDTIAKLL